MPRDASGNYVRVTNSFSNPATGTVINSTDADALFDDLESAMNMSAVKTPKYLVASASPALPNEQVLIAGDGLISTTTASQRVISVGAGTGITVNADDVQLATINPGYLLANASAGTAAPVGVSLSAAIDAAISSASARGVILFRGASAWQALAPGATANALITGGAGADPSWSGAAMPQINNGQLLANVSGATATPVGTALSAYFDAVLGSVQGSIIYRSTASGWTVLGPGTSGQFLRTSGASANLSWATIAGGGDMLAANNLSDVANVASARANLNVADIVPPCGRLAWASTASLSYVPYNGAYLKINGTLYRIPATGVVGLAATNVFVEGVSSQNLATASNYNVYAFVNGGVITADFSGVGHSASTTANNVGIEVKTGDDSRSLIGKIRTPTSGAVGFVDDAQHRFVRSWFNRFGQSFLGQYVTDHTTTATAAYLEVNTEIRCEFLVWSGEPVQAAATGAAFASPQACICALGVDGPATQFGGAAIIQGSGLYFAPSAVGASNSIAEGYHFLTLLVKSAAGSNITFIGNAAAVVEAKCTITGIIGP